MDRINKRRCATPTVRPTHIDTCSFNQVENKHCIIDASAHYLLTHFQTQAHLFTLTVKHVHGHIAVEQQYHGVKAVLRGQMLPRGLSAAGQANSWKQGESRGKTASLRVSKGAICAYNIQSKPKNDNSQSYSGIEEVNLIAAKNTGLQMHLLHFQRLYGEVWCCLLWSVKWSYDKCEMTLWNKW